MNRYLKNITLIVTLSLGIAACNNNGFLPQAGGSEQGFWSVETLDSNSKLTKEQEENISNLGGMINLYLKATGSAAMSFKAFIPRVKSDKLQSVDKVIRNECSYLTFSESIRSSNILVYNKIDDPEVAECPIQFQERLDERRLSLQAKVGKSLGEQEKIFKEVIVELKNKALVDPHEIIKISVVTRGEKLNKSGNSRQKVGRSSKIKSDIEGKFTLNNGQIGKFSIHYRSEMTDVYRDDRVTRAVGRQLDVVVFEVAGEKMVFKDDLTMGHDGKSKRKIMKNGKVISEDKD